MPTKIFVNLPVSDLEKTKQFFSSLGYTFNPKFTDGKAACMVISDTIYAMLITKPFFQSFINKKSIADTATSTEVLLALSAESKQDVDTMIEKALAAGGTVAREKQDLGFMYTRAFEDLDGHTWELFWMDPDHIQK